MGSVLDRNTAGGGCGIRESKEFKKSWALRVVAMLDLRSGNAERGWSIDRDCGGLGKSLRALKALKVRLLSTLNRDASSVMEDVLEMIGFLGMENVLEGLRSSIGSDFDLRSAGTGLFTPDVSSSSDVAPPSQKTGNAGNSFPGM